MFGLSIFEKISLRTHLEVDQSQCLKLRHKKSSCQICLENCPTNAISCNESPEIDYSLCHGCGICVKVCPTGVFELRNLPHELLLTRVSEQRAVEFSCSSLQPVENGLQVPCLGYLHESILLGAVANGTQAISLNIRHCKKCECSPGLQVAARSLNRANIMLSIFGIPRKISMTAKEPGGYRPTREELSTRREFFSYLKERTREMAASTVEAAIRDRETSAKTKVTLNPKLPEKHSLLLEQLKTLGAPITDRSRADDLPFAQVTIGERCNGCGICSRFCPTGALKSYDHDDRQVIDFSSGYCLDCNLCYDICPEGAISYSTDINPNDLVTDSRKILVEHKKTTCSQCGQSHIATPGSTLCLDCQKTKGITEWLVTKRIA